MKKFVGGILILVSLSSCQLGTDTLETFKNNVKESITLPAVLPSIGGKAKDDGKDFPKNDTLNHFTIPNFLAEKLGL